MIEYKHLYENITEDSNSAINSMNIINLVNLTNLINLIHIPNSANLTII